MAINKIIALGDSITQGWTGSTTVASWTAQVSQVLGVPVDNVAVGGSTLTGGNTAHNFLQQITEVDFTAYDIVTIFFGINDFNYYKPTLDDLKTTLATGIQQIKQANPNIEIYGILPIQSWEFFLSLADPNSAGWSQNDMLDAEKAVYEGAQVNGVLDWRDDPVVTDENRLDFLGDQVTHPNETTYVLMGDRITTLIEDHTNLINPVVPPDPTVKTPIVQYSDGNGHKAYAYTHWKAIADKPNIVTSDILQDYAKKSDLPTKVQLKTGTITVTSGLPSIQYAYNDKLATLTFIGSIAKTVTNMQGDTQVGTLLPDIPKPPFDVSAPLVDISSNSNRGHLKVQPDGKLVINMTDAWNGDWISGTVTYAV